MSLNDIVNVSISRDTKAVSRTGFSTINILGISRAMIELIKFYSSASAVLEDFLSTDKEYIAAAAIFSQSPSVSRIAISRRATSDTTVLTVATVADATLYSVTINGTVFDVTSGTGATAASIAAQLKVDIDLGSEPVTITDNMDGTIDIDPDVPATFFSVQTSANITKAFTTSQTAAEDLADISESDDNWYGLVYTDRTSSDVQVIAAYIETVRKIFISASADANIVDTTLAADTTSIAAILKAASYARSGVFYSAVAATQFPDAAILGIILPLDPGSYTSAFKTLAGVTVDTLTETQKTNALAKKANIYVEVGGASITREGTVAEGEYIDIIIFIDWLEANIQEDVYSILVNQAKIPFTDPGIATIEAAITRVLQLGVARGGISASPAFSVTIPKAADVSVANKAARTLTGITFDATLSGAIHAVSIAGTVQV